MAYKTSPLSSENVLRDVHDPVTQTLRTSATALVPPGLEIEVNHEEDSIRLGDGTNFLTSTSSGPSVGLDVNIINSGLKITDGTDQLSINSDGSINVNVLTGGSTSTLVNTYNEVSNVATGVPTVIVSYTAASAGALKSIDASGENIAEYIVYINSAIISKKRTYFSNGINCTFDFSNGIRLLPTDLVEIVVTHNRPSLSKFNANIIVLED